MGKRQGIGYRQRFGILQRDRFACRYCGQRAPSVVLHVDHAVPVAEGGSNDESNLVTSCSACNFGKGAIVLPDLSEKVAALAAAWPEYAEAAWAVATLEQRLGPLGDQLRGELLGMVWRTLTRGVPAVAVDVAALDAASYEEFASELHASIRAVPGFDREMARLRAQEAAPS